MKVVWVYAVRAPCAPAHRGARDEHTEKHRELARNPNREPPVRALQWLTAALALWR